MKIDILRKAVVASAVASAVHAATSDQWRSRAIYQVLTDRFARSDGSTSAPCLTALGNFCGGSYRGIIRQLDYIQGMGFTAVWISPVTYNLPQRTKFGVAWHGYWQQDLYRLNNHFGSAGDLKALSKALHDRDMYLMVDIVTNHNGWSGSALTIDYSKFKPFDNKKYYHDSCTITDYSDEAMVEGCWLGDPVVPLPDLRTEDQAVSDGYNKWIKELVSNYSIDGLRIDTVKYVGKPFWSSFQQAAGVFATGEVVSENASFTCDYQNHLDSVLNYPAYNAFINFLNSSSGSTTSLVDATGSLKTSCKDVSLLGTFTENHDLPRFASQTEDIALAKNALALTLLWDGIPIVYAGQEQHFSGYADPANREATWIAKYNRDSELYKVVAAVNQVRNHAISLDEGYLTYNVWAVYSDPNTVALRKGSDGKQVISVLTNKGNSSASWTLNLDSTGWSAGTTVVEAMSCQQLTLDSDGKLAVPMESGLPRVYLSTDAAKGSGICGITGNADPTETSGGAKPAETNESAGQVNIKRSGKGQKVAAMAGMAVVVARAAL